MLFTRGAILLLLTMFAALNLQAQEKLEFLFRHIKQQDGLLHSYVRSITQDATGFMWILTYNGLQRYDGYRFVNYPYDLNNPTGITDPRSSDLYSDEKNYCLWIINPYIQKFDLKNNRFTSLDSLHFLKDNQHQASQFTDSSGNAWQVSNDGIIKMDVVSKKESRNSLLSHSLQTNSSRGSFVDRKTGNTWMVDYWTGLRLFDQKTKKVYTHSYNPIQNALLKKMNETGLTFILKDHRNNIWISNDKDKFYRYNMESKQFFTYSLNKITKADSLYSIKEANHVNIFFEDNHHTIWLGTENEGLLRYDEANNSFQVFRNEIGNPQGLHYNYNIFCIFQDKEENIWVGTDRGINIFNPYHQFFRTIKNEKDNPLSLDKNEIDCFIQAQNGDVLIGTWGGGITLFDSTLKFKKNIRFASPYEYNLIWSFIQNDDGTIWAGCQHGYIHIYNPGRGKVQTIHPPELDNKTIWCMTKDKAGNIWFGLHDGKIAEWNKKENKFYAYNNNINAKREISGRVNNIFFDSKGQCWVGTNMGLKKFDKHKKIFTKVFLKNKNEPFSVSSNIIEGIEEYDDSTLIIGTSFGGMNFLNTNTERFYHYSEQEGLHSSSVFSIKKDSHDRIWFTTDYGLYSFKKGTKNFIQYALTPGVVSSAFKTTGFLPLKSGNWITASTSELILFDPKKWDSPFNNSSAVAITGFKIFDKDISIDSLLYAHKPINLNYNQNFITIEFASLNFLNPTQSRFEYKLQGIDKDWMQSDKKYSATYTNIPPGKYVFSVRALNGGRISPTTSFAIAIVPPFWQTSWFITLSLLVVSLLVYFFIKWRIKTIKTIGIEKLKVQQLSAERYKNQLESEQVLQQNRIEILSINEQLSKAKLEALRSQMNPHFIFNCINSIDALIQSDDKYHATVYLNKFAKLIRNILDGSNHDCVAFSKDIDTLKLYIELEELRNENKFITDIKIETELLENDYKVPPLIVQPFVENAILHGLKNKEGNKGVLLLSIKRMGNKIQYVIMDNGIGRAAAGNIRQNKDTHYGMQLSKDRLTLFNKGETSSVKIIDMYENEKVLGTKVIVNLNII